MQRLNYYQLLLALFLCSFASQGNAQTKIHRGDYVANYNRMYTVKDNRVYGGSESNDEGALYYIVKDKVYKGKRYGKKNIVFTIRENKIYRANTKDLIYEIDDNKVYRFSDNTRQQCLYTLKDDKIYIGAPSEENTRAFMSLDGADESLEVLTCILEFPYNQ